MTEVNIVAHTGTLTDELETPRWLFDKFHAQFGFDWDACASDENHLLPNYWTYQQNALVQDWGGGKTIWLNYPYSDPAPFLEKAVEAMRRGSFVAALGKFDPSTAWFNKWVLPYAGIRVLNKRVRFYLGGRAVTAYGYFCIRSVPLCPVWFDRTPAPAGLFLGLPQ